MGAGLTDTISLLRIKLPPGQADILCGSDALRCDALRFEMAVSLEWLDGMVRTYAIYDRCEKLTVLNCDQN